METNNYLMSSKEIAKELGVSQGHAYKIIRQLNKELANAGYVVIAGRVPRTYWKEKFFGYENSMKGA